MHARRADERANENELVRGCGQLRQILTNLVAGNLGGNGAELAADLARSLRLEVDHVQVRRPAVEMDIDHRLVRRTDARGRFGPQKARQRHPTANRSRRQEPPTTELIVLKKSKHDAPLRVPETRSPEAAISVTDPAATTNIR